VLKSLKDLSNRKKVIAWKPLSTFTEDAMATKYQYHNTTTKVLPS